MGFLKDLFSNPVGALSGATAAKRQVTRGRNESNATLQSGFDASRKFIDPFFAAGQQGLDGLLNFDPNEILNDPQFKFLQSQGEGSIQRNAAVSGSPFGGNALRDIAEFNQGLSGNFLGQRFGQLQALAGIGQNAGSGLANLRNGLAVGQAGNTFNAGQLNQGITANVQAPFQQQQLQNGLAALGGLFGKSGGPGGRGGGGLGSASAGGFSKSGLFGPSF